MFQRIASNISQDRRCSFQARQALFASVALLILLSGCASNPSASLVSQGAPMRIISLSPNITEILFGIGVFDRVVGVSDYCEFPPEVESLPRVGGWQNTNMEQVVRLEPDLVVMTDFQSPLVLDRLEALGIATLVVPGWSLDDVFAAIEQIGEAVRETEGAERLVRETRSTVEAVQAMTANLEQVRVLCVVDRVPGTLRDLYTTTSGGFLNDLIRIAGGEPIAVLEGIGGYAQLSKEAVVSFDPEVIIDLVQALPGQFTEEAQRVWQELPEVSAVRNGRVYAISDMKVLHPSQFVGSTAQQFAEIIHSQDLEDAQ